MKNPALKQIFNGLALLALVFSIVPLIEMASNFGQLLAIPVPKNWIESLISFDAWVGSSFRDWSFLFAGIIIFVNRENLKNLNIDSTFLSLFVVSGMLYSRYYFWPSGWLVLFLLGITFIYIWKKGIKLGEPNPKADRMSYIILAICFVVVLLVSPSLNMAKIGWVVKTFVTDLPIVLMEEFIFRGLLWLVLRNLNWHEPVIVFAQIILFWFFHAHGMFSDPFFFWILAPMVSTLLGIITWQSRSIAPSTLAHIFINVLWTLVYWAWFI
jgi:hypothetical protein